MMVTSHFPPGNNNLRYKESAVRVADSILQTNKSVYNFKYGTWRYAAIADLLNIGLYGLSQSLCNACACWKVGQW